MAEAEAGQVPGALGEAGQVQAGPGEAGQTQEGLGEGVGVEAEVRAEAAERTEVQAGV